MLYLQAVGVCPVALLAGFHRSQKTHFRFIPYGSIAQGYIISFQPRYPHKIPYLGSDIFENPG